MILTDESLNDAAKIQAPDNDCREGLFIGHFIELTVSDCRYCNVTLHFMPISGLYNWLFVRKNEQLKKYFIGEKTPLFVKNAQIMQIRIPHYLYIPLKDGFFAVQNAKSSFTTLMNYERIYEYRFKQVAHEKKKMIWKIIAEYFFQKLGKPQRILDSAGGMCEFINAVPSPEKWTVDIVDAIKNYANPDVKLIIGDILQVDLPQNYFDAVFISNFLEHLHSQEEVAFFLERMYKSLKPGGKIGIIGPNFKYCYKQYFDFADHTVVLSELGVEEHLYGAGFKISESHARFLPLSFRGGLPVHSMLVKLYLAMPITWWVLGKQFLIVGEK